MAAAESPSEGPPPAVAAPPSAEDNRPELPSPRLYGAMASAH